MTKHNVGLVKHEGERFVSATLYTGGHAYINCAFDRCTMVMTNSPTHLEGCHFNMCNWRIEFDVLGGDPGTRSMLRTVLDLIDGAGDASD